MHGWSNISRRIDESLNELKISELKDEISILKSELTNTENHIKEKFPEYDGDKNKYLELIKNKQSELENKINTAEQLKQMIINSSINNEKNLTIDYVENLERRYKYTEELISYYKMRMVLRQDLEKFKISLRHLELIKLHIKANEKKIAEKRHEIKIRKKIDIGNDSLSFFVSTANNIKKFFAAVNSVVPVFSVIVGPINMAVGFLSTLWDSYKLYSSRQESTYSKIVKIVLNIIVTVLVITTLYIAPLYPVMYLMGLSLFKDAILPLMKVKFDIRDLDKSQKAIIKRMKDLGKQDYLTNHDSVVNELKSLKIKRANMALYYPQFKVVATGIEDEETQKKRKVFNVINGKYNILNAYVNYDDKRNKLIKDKKQKELYLFNYFLTWGGVILCFIPLPPVQIVGAAILILTSIASVVQRYKLIKRVKLWLGFDRSADPRRPPMSPDSGKSDDKPEPGSSPLLPKAEASLKVDPAEVLPPFSPLNGVTSQINAALSKPGSDAKASKVGDKEETPSVSESHAAFHSSSGGDKQPDSDTKASKVGDKETPSVSVLHAAFHSSSGGVLFHPSSGSDQPASSNLAATTGVDLTSNDSSPQPKQPPLKPIVP